jgi:hypothetical protein
MTSPGLTLSIPLPLPPSGSAHQARLHFSSLENWLSDVKTLALPLHCVEEQQRGKGRELQRLLLQAHVDQRGNGDIGPCLLVTSQSASALYTHRRLQGRTLKTLFGPIHIDRIGYGRDGVPSIHPLDEALQLPARSFSYELQKHLVRAAIQGPFQESIDRIQDMSSLLVPKRSVEEIVQEAAQDFDAFYCQRVPEPWQQTASILVVAVDGKGIPLVRPNRSPRSIRSAKGPKPGGKKMATVAAVFTRAPWIRTPDQVVQSLFRTTTATKADPPAPRPEQKRVWASLVKSKTDVIEEVFQEIVRRDPDSQKIRVALTDGERALQILVEKKLQVTLVLDLLHVLDRVWQAAHVFHDEGSPEAEIWARLACARILEGNVCQVIKGLRQTVTKRKLLGAKRDILLCVAGYFDNNQQHMRYNEYLALGLPIASGSVEGACKHLIKDRLERAGMRWTELMAEAVVRLRAIYLSGDFDSYWPFHIRQDQKRIYPADRWVVVVK